MHACLATLKRQKSGHVWFMARFQLQLEVHDTGCACGAVQPLLSVTCLSFEFSLKSLVFVRHWQVLYIVLIMGL